MARTSILPRGCDSLLVENMSNSREGAVSPSGIQHFVQSIVHHPSFTNSLNEILRNSPGESSTVTRPSGFGGPPRPGLSPGLGQSPPSSTSNADVSLARPAALISVSSSSESTPDPRRQQTGTRSTFQTPAQEFSALFNRGGGSTTSTFQRQRNYSGFGPRTTHRSTPYPRNGKMKKTKLNQSSGTFRTKEVVLLPNALDDEVVRGRRKALLLQNGFVNSK
eukprot:gene17200-18930_t